jgi:cyclic beta-1,2-glucan synthetase
MAAFDQQLVRQHDRIIELLTPPFNGATTDPGYIRGYLPGVRENGGQYTHAALWAVMATAISGDHERAFELFQMLNPLTHTDTAQGVARYKVEPYVVAADVYTSPSHVGRGGWTWYTGSASWMYRTALETILGFEKTGDTLRITPHVPASWSSYQITYQFGGSRWEITVQAAQRTAPRGRVTVDGAVSADGVIKLVDDGRTHRVVVLAEAHAMSPVPH